MNNVYNLLPNELIARISYFADPKTNIALSCVDRRTHAIILNTSSSIEVSPRSKFPNKSHPSDIPEDILVKVIFRYQNLKEIEFRKFGPQEVPYLKMLISCLNTHEDAPPLATLKKLDFKEISYLTYDQNFNKFQAKELNRNFLVAMGHRNLEIVKIKSDHIGSLLTRTEIQPMLDNTPNLKSFMYNGFQSDQSVDLSFENLTQLTKVKLRHWIGSFSTIDSLKHCQKLKELIIDHESWSQVELRRYPSKEIKAILTKNHSWDLKRLELKQIIIKTDDELHAITRQLQNLEILHLDELHGISDDGMETLGKNCQHLKILKFSNKDLTNHGLALLAENIPDLEIISFQRAHKITEEGVASIAHSCHNLRFVSITHSKQIKKSGFDALSVNCPLLKAIRLEFAKHISIKGIKSLISHRNLRYVDLYEIGNLPPDCLKKFNEVNQVSPFRGLYPFSPKSLASFVK